MGWVRIKKKKKIPRQSLPKYSTLTLVFISNNAEREKFNFCFFKSFRLVLTKLSFWQGDWALGYHSMGFGYFPVIS